MKNLLFALSFLWSCSAWAATPTFLSFNTNDFLVAPPYISLSRTNTGGTNVFNYTTNVYENSTIIYTNSTIIYTNSMITFNGTNLATINPTIGRVPYNFDGTNFYDSALYFVDTNTVGADQVFTYDLGVTNLVAGGFVISVPTVGGYGVLTNAPFSTFALWTNISGTYFTTASDYSSLETTNILSDQSLAVYGSLRILPNLFTNLVTGENDLDVFNVGSVQIGASAVNSQLRLNTGNGTSSFLLLSLVADSNPLTMLNGDELTDAVFFHLYLSGGDWHPSHMGETMLLYANGNGWAEVGRFGGPTNVVVAPLTINPTDGFLPYRSNVTMFGDSPFQVLDPTLVYQVKEHDPTTKGYVSYRAATNSSDITVSALIGGSLSTTYVGAGSGISTPINVLVSGVQYFDVRSNGHVDFTGFDDGGGTNYSRGAIYHTGTNGAWVFDSQENGTAGSARPIQFDVGGTNYWTFNSDGQMRFGTGLNYALYPSGNNLVYTNKNNFGSFLSVSSDGTHLASYGANGNVAKIVGPDTGAVYIQANSLASDYAVITASSLAPSAAGNLTLGSTSLPWGETYLTNNTSTNYIYFGTNRLSVTGTDLYWNGTKLN